MSVSYSIECSFEFTSDTEVTVTYSVTPNLVGSGTVTMKIGFEEAQAFTNTNSISLASSQTFSIELQQDPAAKTIISAAESSSYGFLVT